MSCRQAPCSWCAADALGWPAPLLCGRGESNCVDGAADSWQLALHSAALLLPNYSPSWHAPRSPPKRPQGPGLIMLAILGWVASKVLDESTPGWLNGLVAGLAAAGVALVASAALQLVRNICKGRLLQVRSSPAARRAAGQRPAVVRWPMAGTVCLNRAGLQGGNLAYSVVVSSATLTQPQPLRPPARCCARWQRWWPTTGPSPGPSPPSS